MCSHFDMGGTTAKPASLTTAVLPWPRRWRRRAFTASSRAAGSRSTIPVVDLIEIGAGGGSIARMDDWDSQGRAQIAGAVPGPACYGRGGEPTVTDADLLLGYLDAGLPGRAMRLDRAAAERAVQSSVASSSGSVADAAVGIHEVANEAMASAARLHLAERGQDAAALTMVAYGGAGPVHAFGLARKLGIRRLLIPPAAGVMSALGMLVANIAVDRVRTMEARLAEPNFAAAAGAFEELEGEARKLLPRSDGVSFKRAAEMRYVGQGYNVTRAPSAPRSWLGFDAAGAGAAFDEVYRAVFGRSTRMSRSSSSTSGSSPRSCRRIRSARLSSLRQPNLSQAPSAATGRSSGRQAFRSCPVIDRYRLRPAATLVGPAFIEERETTTFIGRDAPFEIDERGVLSVSLE